MALSVRLWSLFHAALLACVLLWPHAVAAQAAGSEPAPAPLNPAQATQSDPRAPRIVNANEEVTKARQLFQERKFAEAAQALQRAYAFDPNPLFLFNAGQAYRKAEQRKEALEMYQRYLEVDEKGPLAAEARGYVTDIQAFLGAQDRLQNAQIELETKESQNQKTQQALKAEKERSLFIEQALQKEQNKPFYKKGWFYAVSVVGGGVVLAAVIAAIVVPLRLEAEATIRPSFPR